MILGAMKLGAMKLNRIIGWSGVGTPFLTLDTAPQLHPTAQIRFVFVII